MAEAISTVTSILALLTFTSQLTLSIANLVSALKSAPTELTATEHQVLALHHILRRLYAVLPASNARDADAAAESLQQGIDACAATLLELQRKVNGTQRAMSGGRLRKLWGAVEWNGLRKELGELRVRLEGQKTVLLLWLNIRSLEMLNDASERSTDTECMFAELCGQLRNLRERNERPIASLDQGDLTDLETPLPEPEDLRELDSLQKRSGHDELQSQYCTLNSRWQSQLAAGQWRDWHEAHSNSKTECDGPLTQREGSASVADLRVESPTPPQQVSELETHTSMRSWFSTFDAGSSTTS